MRYSLTVKKRAGNLPKDCPLDLIINYDSYTLKAIPCVSAMRLIFNIA